MKTNKFVSYAFSISWATFALIGCQEKEPERHGTSTVLIDSLLYDAVTETFSLTIHADSAVGACVKYYLYDNDSLIQENLIGVFHNIAPLTDGYDVMAQVEWRDTVIQTSVKHVGNFVVPRKPVEKISPEELQMLVSNRDRDLLSGNDEHLSQCVKILTHDGQQLDLRLMARYLGNNFWSSVRILNVAYNDQNLVTEITIEPQITQPEPEDDEDWFDEW